MEEKEITCHISCQLCGWNTSGTILADEKEMFGEIIKFLNSSSTQHNRKGVRGRLLVTWEPLQPASR